MDNVIINPILRISTMTQISKIKSLIDLQKLYDFLEIDSTYKYIEYANNKPKGQKQKKIKKRKKEIHKKRKFFYNQVTLHIYLDKLINVKVFNNGGIQMTGLKNYEQSCKILKLLISKLESFNLLTDNIIENSKIVLINTDFDIGFEINREILHRLIIEKGYYSSFEPIIYPGVNIKYYYNTNTNGICECEHICDGKGKGKSCKKITVAVFKSGKIIITGGQSIQQMNTAYNFIQTFINDNKELIEIKYNLDN